MFSYKGDRDYIHSSDIINFINRNYLYNKIDITFYKPLRFQPKIRLINKLGNSRGVNIIAKIEKNKIEKFILFYETKLKVKNDYCKIVSSNKRRGLSGHQRVPRKRRPDDQLPGKITSSLT